MRKVFKYEVPVADKLSLSLPEGAKLLTFECQFDQPYLWALVDPDAKKETRRFRLAGTGYPLEEPDEKLRFVGTAQMYGGGLIWHLFEVV